jgi:geranylgeranyl pyrophosphate synthase
MSMRGSDLSSYVAGVDANTRAIIEAAPLHPQQLRLLLTAACGPSAATNPLRHALSPFYLMLRAFGGRPDEAATRLGTSLLLSQRCMCLIDDVEDDELAPELAAGGITLAINAGLALFLLAVDELRAAEASLPRDAGPIPAWESLRTHTLRLCRAQHVDIAGRNRPRTPADAVALANEKSAFACVLSETAALCSARRRTGSDSAYTRIGDSLACMQQMVDDVSDLFGAAPSADLRTGTWTAAVAFLYESMSLEERREWAEGPTDGSPEGQLALMRRVYEAGAMQQIAEVLDHHRERFQVELRGVAVDPAYAAMLTAWVDDLLAIVYCPGPAERSIDILAVEPAGIDPGDLELYRRLRAARAHTLSSVAASEQG